MNLRVWWVPQLPVSGEPFYVNVKDEFQAKLIINTVASYDLYQLENNIRPDYSSVGGVEVYEDGIWVDWYNAEYDDFDEYSKEVLG